MKTQTPKINVFFHLVIVATIAIIYALLNWTSESRIQDFITHQNEIARSTSQSTALEISTYINNRRKLLSLLQLTYIDDFRQLIERPNNFQLRETIEKKIRSVFPEMIHLTLADSEAKQILPKLSDFVIGKGCRNNIHAFSQGHLETIFIHSNPNPANYHFDILSNLDVLDSEGNKRIIFISVGSSVLEKLLDIRASLDHSLFLVRKKSPTKIEVAANANRGSLQRSKNFSHAELESISTDIHVKGTSWNLISILNKSSVLIYQDTLIEQRNYIILFCVIAGLLVSILFYFTDKKRYDAELFTINTNSILEEKVRLRTSALNHQATHDLLTSLINRREFERRLIETLALCKTDKSTSVLLYLDLDQFKIVNDTAGHAAGDELLIEVSSLLKSQLRRGDTLARLGGDEFGIILSNCNISRASSIAEQLRICVKNYGFLWEKHTFSIGVSIGIIEINEYSKSLKDIMSLVDTACYMAKDKGRNQYYIYDSEDKSFGSRHSALFLCEQALSAINNNQLELHAQKIHRLNSNEEPYKWYEVLVRIRKESGLIFPDQIIPPLEHFGQITELDTAVFKLAIKFLKSNPNFKLSINLSGISITKQYFIQFIEDTIIKQKVNPANLCFEITETAAVENIIQLKSFIKKLHSLGCFISLDDFGTGMSSFSYLNNLDVDHIKLDGSFVKNIDEDEIHLAMVDSINSIVKAMGKYVIAEYIENEAIEKILKELGVSHGQGYFIHKPEKLDDIANA